MSLSLEPVCWVVAAALEVVLSTLYPAPKVHDRAGRPVPPKLDTFRIQRGKAAEAEDTPAFVPQPAKKPPPAKLNPPPGYRPARRSMRYLDSVSAEEITESDLAWHPPVFTKDVSTRNRLKEILASNILMVHLSLPSLLTVVEALELVTIPQGTVVVHEGETGEGCYIVESGTLSCTIAGKGHRCDYEKVRARQGQTFGELALMYGNAATDCVLWKLDRQTFKKIVLSASQPNMHSSIAFIHQVPVFSRLYAGSLAGEQQMKIVANSHHLEYQHLDVLVEQGRKLAERYLFIVETGTVRVVKEGKVLEEVGSGGFVGEKAILLDETPEASVVAQGVCKVFRVPETVFSGLPEDVLSELKQKAASRFV